MEAIRDAGLSELLALCGGACSCATCHVYINSHAMAGLAPLSSDEDGLLEGSGYRKDNSRLSCQIRLSTDLEELRLTIAPKE